MKILRCKICLGEADIVGNARAINKKIKCRKCNFSNQTEAKVPEVVIIRKRPSNED
jgi:hypothetical protein